MTNLTQGGGQGLLQFSENDARWQAVVKRDSAADSVFYYSVLTTGIYCRPVCPAKLPLRNNVLFHTSCRDAELAGFRPCKRCKPTQPCLAARQAAMVAQACRLIEQSDEQLSLGQAAEAAGLSCYHFHRVFKAHTGVTPKSYASACRARRVRDELGRTATVTEAIYQAGFNSNGRFYNSSTEILGMTPKNFRAGGDGVLIRYAIGACPLGLILIAASEKGICAILLGDDPDTLRCNLRKRFNKAQLIAADKPFEQTVATVLGLLETPADRVDLPLDIRGTAFQQQVWEALRSIPAGETATYKNIAQRIGKPKAVRAVAQACGANPLAIAIPCHRIIRTDGALSGYRWGIERKRELLRRERSEN